MQVYGMKDHINIFQIIKKYILGGIYGLPISQSQY